MSSSRVLAGLAVGMAAIALAARPASAQGPTHWYVATDGDDRWSGTLDRPDARRADGPKARLTGARDAIRRARAEGRVGPGPLTVHVRGGTYRLQAPLVFEPVDSGTAEAPVVYEAYRGERPVLSGARRLAAARAEGPLWTVEVPEAKGRQWAFRQLFVNGRRATPARSPNSGYYRIAGFFPGKPEGQGTAFARDRFRFAAGDLKPWPDLRDAAIVLMHSWETSIHPIRSIDASSGTVMFAAPLKEWWGLGYWEKAQRYYVENARELLDEPGEWYLDRDAGKLSYWPRPGESPETATLEAPHLEQLVSFRGDPDSGRFVDHVTLRGLAFQHADWRLDPKGNSSTQAAVEVPAAVVADGARHCTIEGCEVAHVGTYGIWFRRGCKDCRIAGNRLTDLGAGGIRVGEANRASADVAESSRNEVDNNHIFDGGRVYAAGVGIWVAQSSGNRIAHNDVHDLNYSGMSIGWNWDDSPNRTHHNIIERNHVHHIARGVLSDAGLIYCLGASPGSVIRENVVHDAWPYSEPPFGWGIYLDATCSGYTVERNLAYNTLSGGLMYNNGGHEHVIQDNIFALSANLALWPYMAKRPNAFRRNIVYLTQGELIVPHVESSLKERLAAREPLGDWDRNVYWHAGGADRLRFSRRMFEEWRSLGLDAHSVVADPRFLDAMKADFRLAGDSPALAQGFRPFDVREAGLYGDPAWRAEASHSRCPHTELPAPPKPPAPLELAEDFEATPIGSPPAHAKVSGERDGASIAVADSPDGSGGHVLRVRDAKALRPAWEPHVYYEPRIPGGLVRQAFDVWLEPGVKFFTEWRDDGDYPANVGPGVELNGEGAVNAAGRRLTTVPLRRWIRVELEARVGEGAPRVFGVTVTPRGEPPRSFPGLPIPGKSFAALLWLGFSSTAEADATFYLDNLRFGRIEDRR